MRVCAAAISSGGTPTIALTVMGGTGVAVGLGVAEGSGEGMGVGEGEGIAAAGVAPTSVTTAVTVGTAAGVCSQATNNHPQTTSMTKLNHCFITRIMGQTLRWATVFPFSTSLSSSKSPAQPLKTADEPFPDADEPFSRADESFLDADEPFSSADESFSGADGWFSDADERFPGADEPSVGRGGTTRVQ